MSQVDRVARAIQQADAERNPTWGGEDTWDQQPDYRQNDYLHMAQAAIEAMDLPQPRYSRKRVNHPVTEADWDLYFEYQRMKP